MTAPAMMFIHGLPPREVRRIALGRHDARRHDGADHERSGDSYGNNGCTHALQWTIKTGPAVRWTIE